MIGRHLCPSLPSSTISELRPGDPGKAWRAGAPVHRASAGGKGGWEAARLVPPTSRPPPRPLSTRNLLLLFGYGAAAPATARPNTRPPPPARRQTPLPPVGSPGRPAPRRPIAGRRGGGDRSGRGAAPAPATPDFNIGWARLRAPPRSLFQYRMLRNVLQTPTIFRRRRQGGRIHGRRIHL